MFLKNVSYNDKVYRNMILEMNKYQKAKRITSRTAKKDDD
jgi:hypothetical protein